MGVGVWGCGGNGGWVWGEEGVKGRRLQSKAFCGWWEGVEYSSSSNSSRVQQL